MEKNAVRSTEIVIGYAEFQAVFRAKKDLVRRWEREGAPIVRDEMRRPITEKYDLWAWMKTRRPKTASSPLADPQ